MKTRHDSRLCRQCRYWDSSALLMHRSEADLGFCIRFPPGLPPPDDAEWATPWQHPRTTPLTTCGEWAALEQAEDNDRPDALLWAIAGATR